VNAVDPTGSWPPQGIQLGVQLGVALLEYGAEVGLGGFLWASAQARGVRILTGGLLLGVLGAGVWRWRRWYPIYLVGYVAVFAVGLTMVVNTWS